MKENGQRAISKSIKERQRAILEKGASKLCRADSCVHSGPVVVVKDRCLKELSDAHESRWKERDRKRKGVGLEEKKKCHFEPHEMNSLSGSSMWRIIRRRGVRDKSCGNERKKRRGALVCCAQKEAFTIDMPRPYLFFSLILFNTSAVILLFFSRGARRLRRSRRLSQNKRLPVCQIGMLLRASWCQIACCPDASPGTGTCRWEVPERANGRGSIRDAQEGLNATGCRLGTCSYIKQDNNVQQSVSTTPSPLFSRYNI